MKIIEFTNKDFANFFNKREPDSHKYDYGSFLFVAGSLGMTGALRLCLEASLVSGAGLVYYLAPSFHFSYYDMLSVEAIAIKRKDLDEKISKCQTVCIGSGLKVNRVNTLLLERVLAQAKNKVVCDGGALRMLAENERLLKRYGSKMILLPHQGEMSGLCKMSVEQIKKNRTKTAYDFYSSYGAITVLKGHKSLVVGEEGIYVCEKGNPGMATPGSGDVLAGMVTAYSNLKTSDFNKLASAVYMHALAGDIASQEYGKISLKASDIVNNIHKAHKEVLGDKA